MSHRFLAKFSVLGGVSFLLCLTMPTALHATSDGLKASSSRVELSLKAGEAKNTRIDVTNESTQSMKVRLQVKAFSVDPKTRVTSFHPSDYNWITPHTPTIELGPAEKREITYRTVIPSDAVEGEYYYALMASTTLKTGQTTKTIQVASLMYLYVDGGNMRRTSDVIDSQIPSFAFGPTIPYKFTIQNTGNVHLPLHGTAQLQGSWWNSPTEQVRAVIMPKQSREVDNAFIAPFMPGIYTLKYSYTDEATKTTTVKASPIIYIPVWVLAFWVLVGLIVVWLWQRRKHHVRPTAV